jgi:hypothetical protein
LIVFTLLVVVVEVYGEVYCSRPDYDESKDDKYTGEDVTCVHDFVKLKVIDYGTVHFSQRVEFKVK